MFVYLQSSQAKQHWIVFPLKWLFDYFFIPFSIASPSETL